VRAWLANPWGEPRFLKWITWGYVFWSLLPVVVAMAFSFNDGRSRTVWQGFSMRWIYQDPTQSLMHDADLRSALWHSMVLAVFAMAISTPIGVALALGLQRWRSRLGTGANVLMLIPLVTPELVMGVALFLAFTKIFTPIGVGTSAQVIGQVTFSISYVVVIVRGRLGSIGKEYEEAAADLGAPPRDVLRRVLFPLLMPAILSGVLIVFALSIDDFVVTSYLSKDVTTETVPIKLYSAARAAPTPALNALGSVMVILTLLALAFAYLIVRRVGHSHGEGAGIETIGGMG
jgi:spermidine/putrescine transport system permease protein